MVLNIFSCTYYLYLFWVASHKPFVCQIILFTCFLLLLNHWVVWNYLIVVCMYFIPLCGLLFHFVDNVLWWISTYFDSTIFLLLLVFLMSLSKILAKPMSWNFPPGFLNLLFLALTFISGQFWVNFLYMMCSMGSTSFFCMNITFPTQFVEKTCAYLSCLFQVVFCKVLHVEKVIPSWEWFLSFALVLRNFKSHPKLIVY